MCDFRTDENRTEEIQVVIFPIIFLCRRVSVKKKEKKGGLWGEKRKESRVWSGAARERARGCVEKKEKGSTKESVEELAELQKQ